MWRLVCANDGRDVLPQLIGYMAERRLHRERWVGAITRPAMPVRLINGSADPVSGAHMVARYRELVPHPDVVALPGVGHYPQVEAPDAVLAAALPFLAAADTTAC
jgi:pimeloyl-ACP methyl ester carboxylesterase